MMPIVGFVAVIAVYGSIQHVVGHVHPEHGFVSVHTAAPLDDGVVAKEFCQRTLWMVSAVVLCLALCAVVLG